jgi:ABC-type transport system involved in multi-copper enzyme maturation permease subunit
VIDVKSGHRMVIVHVCRVWPLASEHADLEQAQPGERSIPDAELVEGGPISAGLRTLLVAWLGAIGLLFLSVIAAASLAEERVRGSLDVLLATPLETWEIVIGKWLGTFRFVPPMAILPMAVVVGIAKPAIRWPMAVVTAAFVLSAGAAITSLGLAMATWCPRLGRAVGLTVSLYLLVTVGWCCAIMAIARGPDSEKFMMGSPFFWPGAVTDGVSRFPLQGIWGPAVFWTMVYALSAVVLLAATLATFNRCLGRVSNHESPSAGGGQRAA